jgi:hypothetical protein
LYQFAFDSINLVASGTNSAQKKNPATTKVEGELLENKNKKLY